MKKVIIVILVLMIAGAVLGFYTLRDYKALDRNVFINTTDSIRNLVLSDNELDIVLLKTRYGIEKDDKKLITLSRNLSEEFDNLRYAAAFEEIEQIDELDNAVFAYDELLIEKLDFVEKFNEQNAIYNREIARKKAVSERLIEAIEAREDPVLLKNINQTILNANDFLLSGNEESKKFVMAKIDEIQAYRNQLTQAGTPFIELDDYWFNLKTIIESQENAQANLIAATEEPSSEVLKRIETAYINYHDSTVVKSNQLRDALTIYGIVLLMSLIYLGFMLRKSFQSLEQKVADRTAEIETAYSDLQESQEQLIQSEKLASLGGMVAGVAHEMNTPLAYVSSNVTSVMSNMEVMNSTFNNIHALHSSIKDPNRDNKTITALLKKTIKDYEELETHELYEESKELLEDGSHGLGEISNLVVSLKDFARLDRQTTESVCIKECIDNTLTIATNHIKENNVNVVREYDDTPEIECIPSKLNQLFLNIVTNASQAIGTEGGTLTIRTEEVDNQIVIDFIDTGEGMDEETQHKMFDPFFTSKPIGQGTGLGMSIAYKIIEAHKGSISVDSKLGVGTTMTVKLPIGAEVDEAA